MSKPIKTPLDAEAFIAWAQDQPGRWELRDGAAVAMAPERAIHGLTKYAAQKSLESAIAKAGLPCRMLPDGMTVRIGKRNAFEPDALVACPPPALDAVEIDNPVIVVEVLSPSTAAVDHGPKLDGYFSLASIAHYLILDPERRVVIHHQRGRDGVIETRIAKEGVLRFDPPGLEATVADMFPAA